MLWKGSVSVSVKLTNEAGRLDLNSAPYEAIEAILEAVGIEQRTRVSVIAALDEKRNGPTAEVRLGSFVELRTLPGMTRASLGCLLPHITLHTGMSEPVGQWAPRALRGILMLEPPRVATGESECCILAGPIWLAFAAHSDGTLYEQIALVRLTGKPRAPVWIYSRLVPVEASGCGQAVTLPRPVPF